MEMKKLLIYILVLILFCNYAYAEIVPRGNSVEIRGSSSFDINEIEDNLLNQRPDPAEPGGYVELRFKVENIGAENANNVMFELIPLYPFTMDKGMSAIRKIGNMHMSQVGVEAYILYYKLRVDKDAIEGNNKIKLRFSNDEGITWQQSIFDIRVQTHDAILHIYSVKSDPEKISQGETLILTISLENNADSLLKDIKVNLEIFSKIITTAAVITEELPITPLGSTNEKIIKNIAPHETKNVTFELIVDADAVSKIYKLPINLDYSDNLGNNFSKKYYTGLIIGETPELLVSVDSSEIISSDEGGLISIRFTNKGASDIKFLYAELMQNEKYNIISPEQVYVGNIDSDDYETIDYNLFVKKTKDKSVQIPLKIEYKDANNQLFKKNVILYSKLYSSKEAKKYGLKEGKNSVWIIAIIAIIIGGIFYYRIYKKKKAKK